MATPPPTPSCACPDGGGGRHQAGAHSRVAAHGPFHVYAESPEIRLPPSSRRSIPARGGDPTAPETDLRRLVRDVPDYPKPGILFRDLTPLFADAGALAEAVRALAEPFRGAAVERVLGIESRGFILGTPVALELGAGFVPVRKAGKLPRESVGESYALEYGSDRLEVHADALHRGERVLIVDDLIATGGTAGAALRLVEHLGATAVGVAVLVELEALGGRAQLGGAQLHAVLPY